MTDWKHLLILSIMTIGCHGARDLYKDMNGGFGQQLTNFQSINPQTSNSKLTTWNLGDDFKIFDLKSNTAYVHFNGFLTFDPPTAENLGNIACQQMPEGQYNFLAPYWRHYDKGEVYVMEYTKESVLPTTSVMPTTSIISSTMVSSASISSTIATSSIQPSTSVFSTSIQPSSSVATSSIQPSSTLASSSIQPSSSIASSSIQPSSSVASSSIQPSISVFSTSIQPSSSVSTSSIQPSSTFASSSIQTSSSIATSSIRPSRSIATSSSIQPSTSAISSSVQPSNWVLNSSTQPSSSIASSSILPSTSSFKVLQSSVAVVTTLLPEIESEEDGPLVQPVALGMALHRVRRESQTPTLSKKSIEQIAMDLNSTFEEGHLINQVIVKRRQNLVAENIEKVILFTWYNMFSVSETKTTSRYLHHFQAALIKVNDLWFVQYYYAVLSSNGQWDASNTENNQQCLSGASMGVDRSQAFNLPNGALFNGVYSQPFLLSSFIEIVSNEYDWRDLGSWVFDLNADVENQPVPLKGICDGKDTQHVKCWLLQYAQAVQDEADKNKRRRRRRRFVGNEYDEDKLPMTTTPKITATTGRTRPTVTIDQKPICEKQTLPTMPPTYVTLTTPRIPSSVTKIVQLLANKFCQYRDHGLYQLPLICSVFISCSTGGNSKPLVCPKGTSFNPRILVCDHESFYECSRGNVEKTGLSKRKIPKPSLHQNMCQYLGFGEYPDPISCNHYYACTNARTIRMPCPHGLFFKPTNSTSGRCDFARKVDCVKGVRGSGETAARHPKQLF